MTPLQFRQGTSKVDNLENIHEPLSKATSQHQKETKRIEAGRMTDKAYDDMTKEERQEVDIKNKVREQEEQAGESPIFRGSSESFELRSFVIVIIALPYKWTQDLTTVSITAALPSGTRAKNLIVEIKKDSLKVISHLT